MQYRKFGRMGWDVSAIGLGTFAIGGYWGPTDDPTSLKVIEAAFSQGINFFDTADVYGLGRSEKLIAEALITNGLRKNIYIATKGGRDFYSAPPQISFNFSSAYLDEALNKSLERLQTDYIDVYQLHGPSIDVLSNSATFEFLANAKADGRIVSAGLSLYSFDEVEKALEYDVVDSIQYVFNMLDNQIIRQGILDLCSDHDVAIIAREPLAQGLLTGKYDLSSTFPADDHRAKKWTPEYLEGRLVKLKRYESLITTNRTLTQAALQYVLAHSSISVVIPGSRNLEQLQENVASLEVAQLSAQEIEAIS